MADDYYGDLEQTQEAQTQPLTQPAPIENHDHLFGYLYPCRSVYLKRVDLEKTLLTVKIGRNEHSNDVIFAGFKISNSHAIIRWNGVEGAQSVVTIEDLSSNGTYLNGEKMGKGQTRLLKDGTEIAFGVSVPVQEDERTRDYRFVFRDYVTGAVKREVYKTYDLAESLGSGSFATVYKALHMSTGKWYAIKAIDADKRRTAPPANTASELARIRENHPSRREIDVMETLRHPNVCQLREAFWNANGSIDLVIELVEGGDLLEYILSRGGLSEPQAKHITYQLCDALAYIHSKDIAHRDLKPENVLLTKDDPPVVKVADFGLAKMVDSMTMLRTMCGTPAYLAPEVVTQTNQSGYDSLVDSWSVGVIEFSMLTNTTPFIENSTNDVRAKVATRQIEWGQLDTVAYEWEGRFLPLSHEVKDFIRGLLDHDPRNRMTLKDSLQHPWLKNYAFCYRDRLVYPDVESTTPTATNGDSQRSGDDLSQDVSMHDAMTLNLAPPSETDSVSQGFEHLKLHGSSRAGSTYAVGLDTEPPHANGAGGERRSPTPPGTPPPVPSPPSQPRKGGLQRRSEVLRYMKAVGEEPEPPWEMIQYANSQSQLPEDEDAPEASGSGANGNGAGENGADESWVNVNATNGNAPNGTANNGKAPNKRVHSELTPLPEEREKEAGQGSGGSSPLSSVDDEPLQVPARKRGRSSQEDTATPNANARTRRGGKAPGSATGVRKAGAGVETTPVPTRRSTRTKGGKR